MVSRRLAGSAGAVLLVAAVLALAAWVRAEGTAPTGWVLALFEPTEAERAASASAPDPPPLVAARHWRLDLTYNEGTLQMRSARKVALTDPAAVGRKMGRFALELSVGPRLLERVRFDFPLLGAGEYEPKRRWNSPPSFERKAHSSVSVEIPDSDQATQLVLVDRASGQRWRAPWPLDPPTPPAPRSPRALDAGRD